MTSNRTGPSPEPELFFDPAEFPLRLSLEQTHYWHLHRRSVVLDAVSGLAGSGARWVDLGCGIGTVALHLNRHGIATDCCDFYEEALALARRRFAEAPGLDERTVRFFRYDLTRDAAPRGGYSGALLLDVIEHLPNDREALRRAGEFLAPGGDSLLVVSVPAFPSLWSPWDVVEHHRRRYTRSSLARALDDAGFELVRLTHFFLPLFLPAAAVKGLRTVRDRVAGPRRPRRITELVETRSPGPVRALLAPALRLERWRLAGGGGLPFGTSLLAIARRQP